MNIAAFLLATLSISSLYSATAPAHYDEFTTPVQYAENMEFLNSIELQGNEIVLDFGCRSGKCTIWFAQQLPNGKVLALDHSPDMLTYVQTQLKKLNVVNTVCMQYTPSSLNLYKNRFDYITSFAYLHWIGNYDSIFKLMHQALKPGGKVLLRIGVSDAVGRKIPFQCHVDAIASRKRWENYFTELKNPWYHPLDIETAKVLLNNSGFNTLHIAYVQRTATFASTEELANWILTWSPHAFLLPTELALAFATEIAERYDAVCLHDAQGAIILERPALEIVAEKSLQE